MMVGNGLFGELFFVFYAALVCVEFCAFLFLWWMNWRTWWQFFLTGAALACSCLLLPWD